MDCSVIKDLIPLYIDTCCSPESARLVEEHINGCLDCRAALEAMRCSLEEPQILEKPVNTSRIRQWKASILQSVLLLCSFLLITVGVALEASTPYDHNNSFWAIMVVVPATGFMLSLINWYFLPLYKSQKTFSRWSLMLTVGITLVAYVWTLWHYELLALVASSPAPFLILCRHGILFSAALCVASFLFSKWYATMLGKE